jgi:hypothetical protein
MIPRDEISLLEWLLWKVVNKWIPRADIQLSGIATIESD